MSLTPRRGTGSKERTSYLCSSKASHSPTVSPRKTPKTAPLDQAASPKFPHSSATAEPTSIAVKWAIDETKPGILTAQVMLKLPEDTDGSTYQAKGSISEGRVKLDGSNWLSKTNSRFCLASYEAMLSLGTTASLDGSWGQLTSSPDGCPPRGGGAVSLTKQP